MYIQWGIKTIKNKFTENTETIESKFLKKVKTIPEIDEKYIDINKDKYLKEKIQ